jgi:hypothetical protein
VKEGEVDWEELTVVQIHSQVEPSSFNGARNFRATVTTLEPRGFAAGST